MAKMLAIREKGMIYCIEDKAFSRSYALAPHTIPSPPLPTVSWKTEEDRQLADGRGGKGGGRGAESYVHKKAWSNINHSILSAGNVLSTEYIFYYKRAILFHSSSKILTPPLPLSAWRVCTPPLCWGRGGGGGHSGQTRRAERGVEGQYFGRREK
jgi:hypothetical protein